jgi:hypothetical protein
MRSKQGELVIILSIPIDYSVSFDRNRIRMNCNVDEYQKTGSQLKLLALTCPGKGDLK